MRRASVDARLEPLCDLFSKLHHAVQTGDRAAEQRRTRRLHIAVSRHPALRRVAAEHVGDVVQAVLVRVHESMHGGGFASVRDPPAWLARVIHNVVVDHARARARRARRFVSFESDADSSGVHRIDRLRADADQFFEAASAAVAHYSLLESHRTPRGAAQIRVWFELRVVQRDAAELARVFGVADRADGGRATIYQWAHRGAELLARLVREDADAPRSASIALLLAAA